jgi:hypothetical protein
MRPETWTFVDKSSSHVGIVTERQRAAKLLNALKGQSSRVLESHVAGLGGSHWACGLVEAL